MWSSSLVPLAADLSASASKTQVAVWIFPNTQILELFSGRVDSCHAASGHLVASFTVLSSRRGAVTTLFEEFESREDRGISVAKR
jgi:hypothetical protein